MSAILAMDAGNTELSLGYYRKGKLECVWRLSSARNWTSDELAWHLHGLFAQSKLEPRDLKGVIAASVVPHLDATLAQASERVFGLTPLFVGDPNVKIGMAIEYKHPREVGADRICAAVAARARYGAPVIVMDCGTATTFDIVSPQGNYAGGLIVPGLSLALQALCERAARLPEVSFARNLTLIGRDTVNSMQAGSYLAALEGLSGIIRRIRSMDVYRNAPVIATGGLSHNLVADMEGIHAHHPHLVLDGLYLLAGLNRLTR